MFMETIAALSTPRGVGGVGMIRITGTRSLEIAGTIFQPKSGKNLSEYPTRYQIYGSILSSDGKTVLDDGLITLFRAPNSFTGEDTAEICCHGGEMITAMVLQAAFECGAVAAEPGEFSRRAFVNGKMTLTAAEGIADLLDAKTESAALLSSASARGKLSEKLKQISDEILALSASLWAYLDYPEEDLQSFSDGELLCGLARAEGMCDKLLRTYQMGKAVNSGVSTVILGKPNAGKSTFFNAMLGENRAIVTEIPGTTRDLLQYPVRAGKVLLNLSDTAGLRDKTDDPIEKMGIEKLCEALEDAELVLAVFDSSVPLDENDKLVLERLPGEASLPYVIPIVTKCDLPQRLSLSEISHLGEPLFISANKEPDFSPLTERIEKLFISDAALLSEGAVLSNMRQKVHLTKTKALLAEAAGNLKSGAKDIASLTLESALAEIGGIDGKSAGEMIINEIFSRFCVGK